MTLSALRDDPLPWAVYLLAARVICKIKSRVLASLLRAPGLYLGPSSIICGSKYIHFGKRFYVHGHLWMEAITAYRGQVFSPLISIGDDVSLSENVHIACISRIDIHQGVLIGSGVLISDHNHGSYKGDRQSSPDDPAAFRHLGGGGTVVIGKNVWIGDNVVIVGPVEIAAGTVIAANSVVRRSTHPNTLIAGIPAKEVKRFSWSAGTWDNV
jgi:acetyltransferase-like isoleucine patch superfamily enzyme